MSENIPKEMPKWLSPVLERLKELEISLGNLLPDDHKMRSIDVAEWLEEKDHNERTLLAERLFEEISLKLAASGYSKTFTVSVINRAVQGANTTLPYCNEDEVEAVLVKKS